MRNTVLAIDDDPMVLEVLQDALEPVYRVEVAGSAGEGLARMHGVSSPDIVLLDVMLPDMHGFDVCRKLKADPATFDIPVIFLSSHADAENISHGLELGAVDYVSKPITLAVLLARLKTHLRLCEANHLLQDRNIHLESLVRARTVDLDRRTQELQQRTNELQVSHDLTILAVGAIVEARDNETGNHIHRTRSYVDVICRALSGMNKYSDLEAEKWLEIVKCSPLHDIGKVGIPDHILLKPGKLTVEEFNIMKQHPAIGRDALLMAEAGLGTASLGTAIEIVYSHHERWDGSGYPEGLRGEAIPLSARIMAVADVYDALISARVYKAAMPHLDALALIRQGRGRHFDPDVADCFLDKAELIQSIATEYSDT